MGNASSSEKPGEKRRREKEEREQNESAQKEAKAMADAEAKTAREAAMKFKIGTDVSVVYNSISDNANGSITVPTVQRYRAMVQEFHDDTGEYTVKTCHDRFEIRLFDYDWPWDIRRKRTLRVAECDLVNGFEKADACWDEVERAHRPPAVVRQVGDAVSVQSPQGVWYVATITKVDNDRQVYSVFFPRLKKEQGWRDSEEGVFSERMVEGHEKALGDKNNVMNKSDEQKAADGAERTATSAAEVEAEKPPGRCGKQLMGMSAEALLCVHCEIRQGSKCLVCGGHGAVVGHVCPHSHTGCSCCGGSIATAKSRGMVCSDCRSTYRGGVAGFTLCFGK